MLKYYNFISTDLDDLQLMILCYERVHKCRYSNYHHIIIIIPILITIELLNIYNDT